MDREQAKAKRNEYMRRWRNAHRELVRDYNRRYLTGKPAVKAYRNAYAVRWRKANKERVDENIRRRRAANPERWKLRFRNAKLKQNYGITQADYDRMLTEQNGVCAICGGLQNKAYPWKLSVDHDKTTGRIRGLLCSACNQGIGSLRHSLQILRNAIAYLEKHAEPK